MGKVSTRPRIAVFTRPLDNWSSGSGHHLDQILNNALDLNNDRFDFTLVHYRRSDNKIYARARELVVPRNPVLASAVLRRENFDVVHYAPLTIYAPIWGIRAKKVATMHGAEQLLQPQFVGKLELAHEYFVVPAYARRMDRIVTVSETSKRFFIERFRIQRDRITVCYNGLANEFKTLQLGEVTAPERYGITRPYVLHVSKFSERKNPWVLLNAFARLVNEYEAPHVLVCAGGGWGDDAVLERARALGIAERYVAPGFVPVRDVAELMNGASLFVFPSLAEGFGMPNVEAMACGCPVVTTPGFAVSEIVGDAAVVAEDPQDAVGIARAMHRIVTDKPFRSALVAKGLARVSRYSWKESAERLLSVYQELISPEPRSMSFLSNRP